MNKIFNNLKFLFAVFVSIALIISCGSKKESKTEKESSKEETKKESAVSEDTKKESLTKEISGRLYFCEDYVQGEEVNVSEKFTTGRITVMVKTDKDIPDKDVSLKLERLKDDGTKEYVDKIAFTIPVTNYIYFKHKDLTFKKPGYYRVTLLGKDGKPIVSGEVTVVQ